MYWKEVPVQVKAEGQGVAVSIPLEARFQEAADALAMFDGSAGTDAYLEGWEWGPPLERPGAPEEAARNLAEAFNSGMPEDFVARIRDLHRNGKRNATPGAIDTWAGL